MLSLNINNKMNFSKQEITTFQAEQHLISEI